MAPTTSQSLLIPSCQLGRILVKVWTRKINPSTWERTAPGPWMDANILDPTFAGTIVFMEREIEHMDLTVGDPVAGLVSGGDTESNDD
ncbi:hypothetical protein FRB96_002664 [Tulasnella sp. 330]|nr:hypothetical protein FRB96_002664 [Tulasnella sp. 330]